MNKSLLLVAARRGRADGLRRSKNPPRRRRPPNPLPHRRPRRPRLRRRDAMKPAEPREGRGRAGDGTGSAGDAAQPPTRTRNRRSKPSVVVKNGPADRRPVFLRRTPQRARTRARRSAVCYSGAPIRCRHFAVVLDHAAEIAAEAVLVELLAGLRVPQPAAVRRELVAQHQRAVGIVGRMAELELVVDEVDARRRRTAASAPR